MCGGGGSGVGAFGGFPLSGELVHILRLGGEQEVEVGAGVRHERVARLGIHNYYIVNIKKKNFTLIIKLI